MSPFEIGIAAILLVTVLACSLWERILRPILAGNPADVDPMQEQDVATVRLLGFSAAMGLSILLGFFALKILRSSGIGSGSFSMLVSGVAILVVGVLLYATIAIWIPALLLSRLSPGFRDHFGKIGRGVAALLRPLQWVLLRLAQLLLFPFYGRGIHSGVTEEAKGTAEHHELIRSVYEFSDIEVSEIMIPKPKINSIQIDSPPEAVLRHVVESGFSRYPVYIKSIDDTVGILYNKDILSLIERRKTFSIRDAIRPIHFVMQNAKVSEVLKNMQRRRMNMFMVVNEFGSVVGLVTIEDAIEEIVGEMHDENEKPLERVIRQADGAMLIDASLSIRELGSDFAIPLEPSENYDTLAGFMLSKIATIPKGGEQVEAEGYRFTITHMDRRRISQIKAELLPQSE